MKLPFEEYIYWIQFVINKARLVKKYFAMSNDNVKSCDQTYFNYPDSDVHIYYKNLY